MREKCLSKKSQTVSAEISGLYTNANSVVMRLEVWDMTTPISTRMLSRTWSVQNVANLPIQTPQNTTSRLSCNRDIQMTTQYKKPAKTYYCDACEWSGSCGETDSRKHTPTDFHIAFPFGSCPVCNNTVDEAAFCKNCRSIYSKTKSVNGICPDCYKEKQ